jgi:hypothetical protein
VPPPVFPRQQGREQEHARGQEEGSAGSGVERESNPFSAGLLIPKPKGMSAQPTSTTHHAGAAPMVKSERPSKNGPATISFSSPKRGTSRRISPPWIRAETSPMKNM